MSVGPGPPSPGTPERDLVRRVARHLETTGYRVLIDPDGSDYFDLVARRGDEVGLVEAKVGNARAVLQQALRRRAWADWCAVVLPSARSAERLARRTDASRAAPVGVWSVGTESLRVHRAAAPWAPVGADDPYAELRGRFRRWLDLVEELGPAIRWESVAGAARRASGGRGFAEWRLDEPGTSGP